METPSSVWVASNDEESNYWSAFAVYATAEIGMSEIDRDRREYSERRLNEFNTDYPPEMDHRAWVATERALRERRLAEDNEPTVWIPKDKDESGAVTEYQSENGYYQLLLYKVGLGRAKTS